MWRKKLKYIVIALFAFMTFAGIAKSSDHDSSTVQADDVVVTPPFTPSADPIKFMFVYWTSGFTLQPTSQYTYIGQPITLSTDTHITLLDSMSSIYSYGYQWYTSNNGTTWTNPSGMTKKKLTVDPTEEGTVYYQQTYTRGKLIGSSRSGYYSQVAFITTYPDPVDALSVDVTVDDDYLYNNQSEASTTFAHAKPNPADSTALLSWSVDDTSLATIDKTTGMITANKSGKSGDLTVIATLTNSDGSTVEGEKTITIGGGLDDETVDEGTSATFSVLGAFDKQPDSVVWHKVVNGKDTTVETSTSLKYMTPETVYTDDGTQYYAVIKVTENDVNGNAETNTITTNKAKLNVIANTIPKVIIQSTVYNSTYNDHNETDTQINNVIDGDDLIIKGTFTDENVNSAMAKGELTVKIPSNMSPTSIKLDGEDAENAYALVDPADESVKLVRIYDVDFSTTKSHTYEIDVPAADNGVLEYVTTPSVQAANAAGQDLPYEYLGNPITINFTDNKLTAQANPLDYGQLKYSSVGKPVNATIDGQDDADMLSVSDNRRDKDSQQIYLAQTEGFVDDDNNELQSELRYYDSSGNYQLLSSSNLLVSDISQGDTVNSIVNNENTGLRLYIHHGSLKYSQYTSTLLWTIQNTPI